MRQLGQVQRRDSKYIGRMMFKMELPGMKQRRRPKRRLMEMGCGKRGYTGS